MPKGIMPRNIAAFTFTDKAAAELKSRIALLCRNKLGEVNGLAEMYVGTIHGFSLELLQTYMHRFLKYTVLDEVQARLLVDRLSTQSGMKDLGLQRYRDSSLYLDVLEVIREAKVDLEKLKDHPVLQALEKYEDLLDKRAYLDYTKIMTEAVEALSADDDLKAKIRDRVKYLVVDEYQDVNPLQEALIRLLSKLGANVCVVGDDDQAIYEWRGTDVENILSFEKRYPNVKVVRLEENFRSSKGGVEVSDPLFLTTKSLLDHQEAPRGRGLHSEVHPGRFLRLGGQQRKPGVKRYRIHGHEFRDTFRTTCKVTGVD
jgi:DNA helicase-2/ATP-dependent DNA helicase PcrA